MQTQTQKFIDREGLVNGFPKSHLDATFLDTISVTFQFNK